eukprot:881535-Prymnesium_polylepis.1
MKRASSGSGRCQWHGGSVASQRSRFISIRGEAATRELTRELAREPERWLRIEVALLLVHDIVEVGRTGARQVGNEYLPRGVKVHWRLSVHHELQNPVRHSARIELQVSADAGPERQGKGVPEERVLVVAYDAFSQTYAQLPPLCAVVGQGVRRRPGVVPLLHRPALIATCGGPVPEGLENYGGGEVAQPAKLVGRPGVGGSDGEQEGRER